MGRSDPYCQFCTNCVDSAIHALRDCRNCSLVWTQLVPSQARAGFFMGDLSEWVSLNFTSHLVSSDHGGWLAKWAMGCYHIWRWRNRCSHDPHVSWLSQLGRSISIMHSDYLQVRAIKSKVVNMQTMVIDVRWQPPATGWAILHTYGAAWDGGCC